MDQLENNESLKSWTDDFNWIIYPMLNPDGYLYSWEKDRFWRKNRNPNDGHWCKGVDLNRNYDIAWASSGSSSNKCAQTYHGKSAFSEPESLAHSEHMKSLDNIQAYLTYHAYAEFIIYPYSSSYEAEAKNKAELEEVAQEMVNNIKSVHSKLYSHGEGAPSFYPAAGGSDDWAHSVGVPLSFTIELRDTGSYGFIMPDVEIIPTCEENMEGIRAVVDHLQTPKPPVPPTEPIDQGPFVDYQVGSFNVGAYGFIPQDRPNTFTHEEAKAECIKHFGKGWELSHVDLHVLTLLENNELGHLPFWVDINECLYVKDGVTQLIDCNTNSYDEYTGMSILCHQKGGPVTTEKVYLNSFFIVKITLLAGKNILLQLGRNWSDGFSWFQIQRGQIQTDRLQ